MRVASRLIFAAFFVEVGLLLAVAPWSPYWDRNYFIQIWPWLATLTRNDYVRGAVTGLGLLNLWAGAVELAGLIRARS